MTTGGSNYEAAWSDYRARRRTLFIAWLGGPVLGVAVGEILLQVKGVTEPRLFPILACGWILAYLVTALKLHAFRCPRCGECFTRRPNHRMNPFVRGCVHCGIRVGDHPA